MEYKVLRYGGIMKKTFYPVLLLIHNDELEIKKEKDKEMPIIYHIKDLLESFVEEKNILNRKYVLIIKLKDLSIKEKIKEIMISTDKENSVPILSEIKNLINYTKIEYTLNLRLFNLKQIIKNNQDIDSHFNEYKVKNKNYNEETTYVDIKTKLLENLKNKNLLSKTSNLLNGELNTFINKINELNSKNYDTFNQILDGSLLKVINDWNENKNNSNNNIIIDNAENKIFNFDNLLKGKKYYLDCLKLLILCKNKLIKKKFKVDSLKYNENVSIPIIAKDPRNQSIDDNKDNQNNDNKNNIIDNNDSQKNKNEELKNKMLIKLNENSKKKETLKNFIMTHYLKLYTCIICNYLLKRTQLQEANCKFDSLCTNRSYFYCKKCKTHFCTKCIIYQRGLKCGKNHSFFPMMVDTTKKINCYICDMTDNFPYYECKFCNEKICSDCATDMNMKENCCFNCNNELCWGRGVYSNCNKCGIFGECFYFCIFCDYNLCLRCYKLPNKKCGAFHELKLVDVEKEKLNETGKFINSFLVKFNGKCSLCSGTIGCNKVWSCLRCSLFLCDKCVQKQNE